MIKGDSPYVTFPSLNIPYLYTQEINNSVVIWDVAKAKSDKDYEKKVFCVLIKYLRRIWKQKTSLTSSWFINQKKNV